MSLFTNNKRTGFTVLYAVLVTSLVLTVGVSIFNIAFKELILSSQVRDSQFAFFAADSGIECALYWDFQYARGGFGQSVFGGHVSVDSLGDGLIGFWSLNDGTGFVAQDNSINTNDGALMNMEETDWVVGQVGGALQFNSFDPEGTGDEYVDVSGVETLVNTTEGSISLWLNADGVIDTDAQHLLSIGNSAAGTEHISVLKSPSNNLFLRYRNGNVNNNVAHGISQGSWIHVVGAWSADMLYLYVDGVLEDTADKDVGDIDGGSLDQATIGIDSVAEHTPELRFEGMIDEVRLYNRVLTQSEAVVLAGQDLFSIPLAQNPGVHDPVDCAGSDITDPSTGWDTSSGWVVTTGVDSAQTVFDLAFTDDTCATVTVFKQDAETTIESRGYNTCNLNDPNRVERGLRATY